MSRHSLVLFLAVISAALHAQTIPPASPCLPRGDYIPALVANPGNTITFQCDRATPLSLIFAIGFQTRTPIGIALGTDPDALTLTTRAYSLQAVDIHTALSAAIEGTGYTIHDEDGVVVLIAGDLAPRQRDLLLHSYSGFGANRANKMACWGIYLTIALRQAARPLHGFATSCSTSPNDEDFPLNLPPSATTQQIANAIVGHGAHGIWLFKVPATAPPPNNPTEEVAILPYQHYTNRPISK